MQDASVFMNLINQYSRWTWRLAGPALLAVPFLAGAAAPPASPTLSPAESMATFQLEPGLRVELVAAEPLVVDPVAFAFDENRRLYVVEGRGYPEQDYAPYTHEGRVARLEDTDGDGRYDRRTEFATGLTYPNGITVWRGGVFVTCAPDIYYLKDTTGDGVADERRVVLTGFSTAKSTHSRVSAPVFGWDGMIHVACGANGGRVVSPAHPDRPAVDVAETDGRFDPETYGYESTGGRSQFGLAFDAFGRRFGSVNRSPVRHAVLDTRDLERNPYLAFNSTVQLVSRNLGEAKVYPISDPFILSEWNRIYRPEKRGISHVGTFTAGSGLVFFDGTGLTDEHVGDAFICEPAQNVVQRQILRPEGASFLSDPAQKGREFLAATDLAFRPVFVGNGPDGALYIADMYRREIEHPHAAPPELLPMLDYQGGRGTGRIYRIVQQGRRVPPSSVSNPTTADLCRQLESSDGWWRETAHRLLVERADPAAVLRLEKRAVDAPLAESRARMLWVLQGLRGLSSPIVVKAMRDPHPGVREQAVRLADSLSSDAGDVLQPLLAAARDPDARVRFNAALVLGSHEGPGVVDSLAAIAVRDGRDPWARAAVLSGIGARMERFFGALGHTRGANIAAYAVVTEDLARIYGGGASPEACRRFVEQVLEEDEELAWCLPAILNLIQGTAGRADAQGRRNIGLTSVFTDENPAAPGVAASEDPFHQLARRAGFERLARLAGDDRALIPQRVSAVALLGYGEYGEAARVVAGLLEARQDPALQLQAVRAIERLGDARGAELLIQPENWKGYTPKIRSAVISTLSSKPALVDVLFDGIERGTIPAAAIPSQRRARLLQHANPKIRQHAEESFRRLEAGDRMQVYRSYRDILDQPADTAHGAEVFVRACSACHEINGIGGKVGPDLTGYRNHAAEVLLLHILVPNHEIAPGYEAVTVTTRDGSVLSGRIVSESDNGLTLRTSFDAEEIVARPNIAAYVAAGVSLMPEGLEQTMTREELADLIAYLRRKAVPSPSEVHRISASAAPGDRSG